jgi:N-acetylmuramoyl-L-alanine amidase
MEAEPMTRRFITVPLAALVLAALAATTPLVASTAKDLYTTALADERQLRAPADKLPTLAQFRDAIGAYKELVRQHPQSGYSDNALWQAAGLAIQAFDTHRQPVDHAAGERFLRTLEREYPSSSLVPRVADRIEELRRLAEPVQILAIHREPLADVVRVTIEIDDEVRYHSERLEGPARLFFDFSDTYAAPPLRDSTLAFEDGDMVREIRLGRHPGRTTRVVLDLENVDHYSVYSLYNPYRLVIDTVPTASMQARRTAPTEVLTLEATVQPRIADVSPPRPSAPAVLAEPERLAARQLDPITVGLVDIDFVASTPVAVSNPESALDTPVLPVSTDPVRPLPRTEQADENALPAPATATLFVPVPSVDVLQFSRADQTVEITRQASAPVNMLVGEGTVASISDAEARLSTGTAAANSDGALSLGRQLGLGVSRIVIDPGHGGYDPGAQTGDMTESALVLDVATRLEARLAAETSVEVILTRRSDAYMPLRARTQLANRVGADLFLSIHANAAQDPSARGVETYYLDLATESEAQIVAARENAASREGMHDLPNLVRTITMDNKLNESRDLAGMVQRNIVRAVRELYPGAQDLGVKKAPFVVLIGANMPSVLAEISFLTNQEDAAFLETDAYRDRIADALLQAILEYQRALKPPASVIADN